MSQFWSSANRRAPLFPGDSTDERLHSRGCARLCRHITDRPRPAGHSGGGGPDTDALSSLIALAGPTGRGFVRRSVDLRHMSRLMRDTSSQTYVLSPDTALSALSGSGTGAPQTRGRLPFGNRQGTAASGLSHGLCSQALGHRGEVSSCHVDNPVPKTMAARPLRNCLRP